MIPFIKMHGCGNDFVIVDCREDETRFSPEMAAPMASRQFGIGCDQVIVLREGIGDLGLGIREEIYPAPNPQSPIPAIFMSIYNADGSQSDACGNATRCVAWLLMEEQGIDRCVVVTNVAEIECWRSTSAISAGAQSGSKQITVNMGEPRLEWNQIPLSQDMETLHLPMESGALSDAVAVNMGNPHAVFFVDDLEAAGIETHGPVLEHDALLPERGNISAVQVVSPSEVKAKVWERGSGLTLACGTGACAIAVAGIRRGLLDRKCAVNLPGGTLEIEWCDESSDTPNHVLMTGPVVEVFRGEWVV